MSGKPLTEQQEQIIKKAQAILDGTYVGHKKDATAGPPVIAIKKYLNGEYGRSCNCRYK